MIIPKGNPWLRVNFVTRAWEMTSNTCTKSYVFLTWLVYKINWHTHTHKKTPSKLVGCKISKTTRNRTFFILLSTFILVSLCYIWKLGQCTGVSTSNKTSCWSQNHYFWAIFLSLPIFYPFFILLSSILTDFLLNEHQSRKLLGEFGCMVPQEICWILTPVSPISWVSECDRNGKCIIDCAT